MYGCGKDYLIFMPLRLSQISCFTLSLKCFSSDSDNWPDVGIRPLLQFPHPPRAGPILLTFLFFPIVPLSYQVLCGSMYSLPLVNYSYPLSAGALHALSCLKCIPGVFMERCTPYPHTPLPSCSLQERNNRILNSKCSNVSIKSKPNRKRKCCILNL